MEQIENIKATPLHFSRALRPSAKEGHFRWLAAAASHGIKYDDFNVVPHNGGKLIVRDNGMPRAWIAPDGTVEFINVPVH